LVCFVTQGRVNIPYPMIFWKVSKGGGIFNPKIYIADFGKFKQGFLIMKLIKNSNFRVCFFNNFIENKDKLAFKGPRVEP